MRQSEQAKGQGRASTVLEMPLRAQVGGLAATLAVLCGLLVAMIAVGARGPAPSALWNAAGEDSIRLRSQALGDLDDAEVRETAQLPVPGVHRVFREDADHQRNYEGSYVSDNSIGLQVDALAGRAGRQQMLYQRGSWHALNPVRVLRADANFGYPTVKQPSRTKKAAPPADHFFGLQHWGFGSSALARAHPVFARTQQLHEQAKTSSFIDITQPDKTDADGYVDAGAYSSQLAANAVKGQGAYIANWHAKNLKAGKQMVRDAAKLYAKWDLVDPTTGRSKPNMVIPQNRDDSDYEDTARAPRLRLFQNGPMLTDAHLMMLKEVKADNGRTYVLPWWCVVVHPEANGDGKPTGLSDARGHKYPEGAGWDGGKTPMGASGIPGVDCTHPGGSTLVPYDKEWPLWKGPRVTEAAAEAETPTAAAEPISEEEAAQLERGTEAAAEDEPDAGDSAAEAAEGEGETVAAGAGAGGETAMASDTGRVLAMERPAGAQILAAEPAASSARRESSGELQADNLGDEVFELPQDYGDVQMDPAKLEPTIMHEQYYR